MMMMTKQTPATAHVGVWSSSLPPPPPPAIIPFNPNSENWLKLSAFWAENLPPFYWASEQVIEGKPRIFYPKKYLGSEDSEILLQMHWILAATDCKPTTTKSNISRILDPKVLCCKKHLKRETKFQ